MVIALVVSAVAPYLLPVSQIANDCLVMVGDLGQIRPVADGYWSEFLIVLPISGGSMLACIWLLPVVERTLRHRANRRRTPTLTAERVRLRVLETKDAGALFEIYGDAAHMKYWDIDSPASIPDMRAQISRDMMSALTMSYLIETRSDDCRPIGVIFLKYQSVTRMNLGFILHPDVQGQGYGREAVKTVLDYLFGQLGLHRVEAETDVENVRAIALLDSTGFQREGTRRARHKNDLGWRDAASFGLLADEHTKPAPQPALD